MEGAVSDDRRSVSSPSVTFGDTSPLRGRIEGWSIRVVFSREGGSPVWVPAFAGSQFFVRCILS